MTYKIFNKINFPSCVPRLLNYKVIWRGHTVQKHKILRKLKGTADEEEREQLTAKLQTVISKRFDVILKRKKLAYDQMLRKLRELQKEVKKNKAELDKHKDPDYKNKNVKARLQKLIEQTEEFNWD